MAEFGEGGNGGSPLEHREYRKLLLPSGEVVEVSVVVWARDIFKAQQNAFIETADKMGALFGKEREEVYGSSDVLLSLPKMMEKLHKYITALNKDRCERFFQSLREQEMHLKAHDEELGLADCDLVSVSFP